MVNRFRPTWKLIQCEVDPTNRRLRITGKAETLTALGLWLMGVNTTATLEADDRGVRLKSGDFVFGDVDTFCAPTQLVTSFISEAKPNALLILGIVLLPAFGLGLLILLAYMLAKRKIIIGIGTTCGTVESIKFKVATNQVDGLRFAASVLESLIAGPNNQVSGKMNMGPAAFAPQAAMSPPNISHTATQPYYPESHPAMPTQPTALTPQFQTPQFQTPQPTPTMVVVCPSCGKQHSIPGNTPSGKRFRCPACQGVVQVP